MSENHEDHDPVSQGDAEVGSPSTTTKPTDGHDDPVVPEEPEQPKRLSAYSFSNLPEVVPESTYQGKEVVPADTYHGIVVVHDDHKETVANPGGRSGYEENLPEAYKEERGGEAASIATTQPPVYQKSLPVEGRLNRRLCGIRAKWILLGVALLILLIVALGVGLGVGLHSHSAAKAKENSQSGAFNGTKIALVTQSFATDQHGGSEENLVMYFQHWSGEIRWMRHADDGQWTGGDSSTVVARDAKNNTPIAAVSYVWDGVSFWRVFYINELNTITEVWAGNNTQGWALGPLSTMGITPLDDDQVGMVACWYGPTIANEFAEGYSTTTDASQLLIRLVYAKDATTFEQLSYQGSTQLWTSGQTLTNLNGRATPACYNRDQGTVDYLMVVNLHNTINVYWRDTNTSLTNTTSHPIDQWTNASIAIPNVEPSATLGYTKYLYAQDLNDKLITAYSISFAAENTTLNAGSGFVVQGNPGLPNTGLAVTYQPVSAGGGDVLTLYQTDGSDISFYERLSDGVSWTGANIRVPP